MSGIFIMRKTETGSAKIGESKNGAGPAPARVLGHEIGACGNLDPAAKQELNKALQAAGFERNWCSVEKISIWSRVDGAQFEVEMLGRGFAFFQRMS